MQSSHKTVFFKCVGQDDFDCGGFPMTAVHLVWKSLDNYIYTIKLIFKGSYEQRTLYFVVEVIISFRARVFHEIPQAKFNAM